MGRFLRIDQLGLLAAIHPVAACLHRTLIVFEHTHEKGRSVYRFFSILFAIVVSSALCIGQERKGVDVFGAFSYMPTDLSLTTDGAAGISGWNASATIPTGTPLGMVFDFAGYYPGYNVGCGGCGQNAKIHTFLFGPQVSVTRGRFTPFARFLLGDTHMTTLSTDCRTSSRSHRTTHLRSAREVV